MDFATPGWRNPADLIRPGDSPKDGEYVRPRGKGAAFQRRPRASKVAAIAEHFDPGAFGRVLVARLDDEWIVIDGYHRVCAAFLRGMDKIPVDILDEAGYSYYAGLYVHVNKDRTRTSATEEFHADCESGLEEALFIDSLLVEYKLDARGLEDEGRPTTEFTPINFVAPFQSAMRNDDVGEPGIRHALDALRDVFGEKELSDLPWYVNSRVISGVIEFVSPYEQRKGRKVRPYVPPTPEETRIVLGKYHNQDKIRDVALKSGGGTNSQHRRPGDPLPVDMRKKLRELRNERKRQEVAA